MTRGSFNIIYGEGNLQGWQVTLPASFIKIHGAKINL